MTILSFPIFDLMILSVAAFLAGMIRGFVGFGTAMIYLPIAALFLSPIQALMTLVVIDLFGPLPLLPKVAKDVHRKDLTRLLIGTVIALPIGIATLLVLSPDMFRFIVSVVALVMLAGLIGGWRYHGTLPGPAVVGTGMAAGFLGGVAGIPGPPVIFVYMASPHSPNVIRANTTFYLYGYDILLLIMLLIQTTISWTHMVLGLILSVPYLLGNLSGAALFRPDKERVFRYTAYTLIAGSAVIGLPFWG